MRIPTRSLSLLASLCFCLAAGACGQPAATPGDPLETVDAGADPGLDAGVDPGTDAGGEPGADAGPVEPVDAGANDAGIVDCPPLQHEGGEDAYSDLEHLRDGALRAALLLRVTDHFELTYNQAKDALFDVDGIDVSEGRVECIYTGATFNRGQLDECKSGGFNLEHSWPQSDFFGTDGSPKTDLHHLFATECGANSFRASLYFGETDCAATGCTFDVGGSSVGPSVETGMRVFEVRPKYRGEVARAHFYMAVRHEWSIPDNEERTLRRWNRCDPPDDAERARNDKIEAIQENRNPFVDRPEFVDYIGDFD